MGMCIFLQLILLLIGKMVGGKMTFFHKGRKRSKVQKVVVVKPKRKRRGPKITNRLLSNKPITVKMRYVDLITLDPGAGAIVSYVYRANSIFKPDFANTGHQPLTRDQWALLYNSYRVLKSTVKVTPLATTISNVVSAVYGVMIKDTTTLTYASAQAIIEDPRNRNKWGITGFNTLQSSKTNKSVFHKWSNRRLDLESRDNTVDQGSNPTDNTQFAEYFHIYMDSVGAGDAGAATYQVEIDYTVELSSPVHLTQS